jgi:acetaldehyde dehydrogenase
VTVGAVIIGSGNIGTDLMIKIKRLSTSLHVAAMVGVDPSSEGLARARRLGVPATDRGVAGLADLPGCSDARFAFDATSAGAHPRNAAVCRRSWLSDG